MICRWGDDSDVLVQELKNDSIEIHVKRGGWHIEPDARSAAERLGDLREKGFKVPDYAISILCAIDHGITEQSLQPKNVWQRAIDEELVKHAIGVASDDATFEQAKQALNDLIMWNIEIATDFRVGGDRVKKDEQPEA